MKICETYSGSFICIVIILLSFATVKDSSSSFDDHEKIYNVFRKQFPLGESHINKLKPQMLIVHFREAVWSVHSIGEA